MRVSVVRGGGVAGIATRTDLDQSDLSPEDAQTFAEKVRVAGLSRQTRAPARTWPDQVLYEVVVVDDESETRWRFSDQDMPEDARLLIEWIESRPEHTQRLER